MIPTSELKETIVSQFHIVYSDFMFKYILDVDGGVNLGIVQYDENAI